MKERTPEQETQAFKRRVEELLQKEARCPDCAKWRRLNEGKTFTLICERHQNIRSYMAFPQSFRRYGR